MALNNDGRIVTKIEARMEPRPKPTLKWITENVPSSEETTY